MPPVTPRAITDISTPNCQLPDARANSQAIGSWALGSWELSEVLLVHLHDLAPQHFALRDGHLLLARLARYRAGQQLAGTLACQDDELKPLLFGCSFHSGLPFQKFQ